MLSDCRDTILHDFTLTDNNQANLRKGVKMKGILGFFQSVAKYGSLFGFGFFVFFFRSTALLKEQNPDANLLDIGVGFYEGMANLTANYFLPGAAITIEETFKAAVTLTADYLVPGISFAFNALSHSMQPAESFTPKTTFPPFPSVE